MAIKDSDFLLVHRNGENYKAPVSDLQLELDFLPTTGGNLTGNVVSNALYKTTRNEGYAFQVRPNNADTTAYIHTSGHAIFTDRVEVDGKKVSLEDHAHDYLPLEGGTVTGELIVNRPGGNRCITIQEDGSWVLKIWSNGSVETRRTTFSDSHLISRSYADSSYAESVHNHDTSYVKGDYTITKSGGNYYIS